MVSVQLGFRDTGEPAKEAWAKAMQGRGLDLFQKPFSGEQG